MGVTFELPEDLVERLEAEAERRGNTVEQLAVAASADRYVGAPSGGHDPDALGAFIGSMDSGDPERASTGPGVSRRLG